MKYAYLVERRKDIVYYPHLDVIKFDNICNCLEVSLLEARRFQPIIIIIIMVQIVEEVIDRKLKEMDDI